MAPKYETVDDIIAERDRYKRAALSPEGEWVGRADLAALRKDAERYRWLKSRQGLTLRSEKQPNVWKRIDGTEFSATHSLAEGGTQHAPADSLDALIDTAMLAACIRDA